MIIKCSEINWDTDGQEVDLPTTVFITGVPEDWEDRAVDFEERLTEVYDFCHKGFSYEAVKSAPQGEAVITFE